MSAITAPAVTIAKEKKRTKRKKKEPKKKEKKEKKRTELFFSFFLSITLASLKRGVKGGKTFFFYSLHYNTDPLDKRGHLLKISD